MVSSHQPLPTFQRWKHREKLSEIVRSFPHSWISVHDDNGGELINEIRDMAENFNTETRTTADCLELKGQGWDVTVVFVRHGGRLLLEYINPDSVR